MLRSQGLEIAQKAGIDQVTTSATGANWVQLTDRSCNQVTIYNDTGAALRVRYCNNAGVAIPGDTYLKIPDGIAQPLRGLSNSKQLQVQRDDTANTQVTAKFTYESV